MITCCFRSGLLLLLLAIPITGEAHREIFFPKLFSQAELPNTGFVFLNPDTFVATVNVYLINANGAPVSSGVFTVAAGGQTAKLGSDLFPNPPSAGWVYILNDAESMECFWLNYDSGLTSLDGSEAAQYETIGGDQIIPLVAGDAELNVINPNFSKTTLTIRVFGNDGELAPAFSYELPIAGAFQSKVSAMYSSLDMSRARYLRIRSAGLTIASTILIRGFLVPGDSVVLNGLNTGPGPQTQLTFAHAVSGALGGANYTTVLGVTNPGASSQTITLTFNPDEGNPVTVTRVLPPNGAMRETAQGLFGLTPDFQSGWIRVSGTSTITGFLAYADTAGGGVAVVPPAAPQTKFLLSHIADGPPQWQTGFALLNPGGTPADVEMYAMNPDGTLIGNTRFTLDPGKKLANVIHQLIPQTEGVNGGFVYVRTANNVPINGIELFYTADLKVLASIAPATLLSGVTYTPPSH